MRNEAFVTYVEREASALIAQLSAPSPLSLLGVYLYASKTPKDRQPSITLRLTHLDQESHSTSIECMYAERARVFSVSQRIARITERARA